MKEMLKEALQAVQEELKNTQGWALSESTVGLLKEAAESVKKLPRTEDGIFDMEGVEENAFKAGGYVYPICACYETICNKKEGYPDLLEQIHFWDKKLKQDFTYSNTAAYLHMLIDTIQGISEEIYEYYRELIDIFREVVKGVMKEYPAEAVSGSGDDESDRLFASAIRKACEQDVLLKEKYQSLL